MFHHLYVIAENHQLHDISLLVSDLLSSQSILHLMSRRACVLELILHAHTFRIRLRHAVSQVIVR